MLVCVADRWWTSNWYIDCCILNWCSTHNSYFFVHLSLLKERISTAIVVGGNGSLGEVKKDLCVCFQSLISVHTSKIHV